MPVGDGALAALALSVGSVDAEREGGLVELLRKKGINAGADMPVRVG